MKATGIVRRIDELGRLVLPSELRKVLHVSTGDPFELYTQDDKVILKKYEPGCILTGELKELVEYRGRKLSKTAIKELAELIGLI